MKSGAKNSNPPPRALRPRQEDSIPSAIAASLPMIQKADSNFSSKAGCVSCHNNSLAAMAVGMARKSGFRVDEQMAAQQVKANLALIERSRERLQQGFIVPVGDTFGSGIFAYILIALDAEHYKPDIHTDITAMYIRMHQHPEGNWATGEGSARPPLGADYIGQTALSLRALQLYAPKTGRAAYDRSIRQAAAWLAKARARTNQDATWRLTGLAWEGPIRPPPNKR